MNNIISIEHLLKVLMPVIGDAGIRHRKCAAILARPAVVGEHITTWTSSGKETENTAKEGDFLVQNITPAQEQYIVGAEKFNNRYEFHQKVDDLWSKYLPTGEILALLVTKDIMQLLGKDSSFLIEAPWGDSQPVQMGDYLASPLPKLDQIYRIGREEFFATYEISAQ